MRSGLAAARTAQARAELDLENTEIRAPFAGVVSGLDRVAGEQVIANQTLCQLVDQANLEADIAGS